MAFSSKILRQPVLAKLNRARNDWKSDSLREVARVTLKAAYIWGAVWKKTIRFVNHVFWAYLDHSLSDKYIGNVLLIYRTKCTLSRTKIHAQNKSDKIVFFSSGAPHAFWKKTILSDLFCACILVRLRVHFVWYISRTFPIYISDKLWSK